MKLPNRITEQLASKAESGMGYQICDAVMNNGETVKDILVANGNLIISIQGSQDFNSFQPDNIVDMIVQG